jgi:hypothetical protein
MCFTPAVSLVTAIIEWLLAFVLVWRFGKSRLTKYLALALFLLGFYQFTEFMLCMSDAIELWGTASFIAYTFLPAIGLGAVLAYLGKRVHSELIYGLPTVFVLSALITRPFIVKGKCETIFVTILTIFSESWASIIYIAYYSVFLIVMCYLLSREYLNTKNARRKQVCILLVASVLLMTIPTIIVVTIFPALGIRFGSVLCHFALLTAIASFAAVVVDSRRK